MAVRSKNWQQKLPVKVIVLLAALTIQSVAADNFDHSIWDKLLKQHVEKKGLSTVVDYRGMLSDHAQLKQYLKSISTLLQQEFEEMDSSSQLAFLINAYNAWTIELVLSNYPELNSIKDLGNFIVSPWSRDFIPLFGEKYSLNDIEHRFIRGSGRYQDPRIHFAINCASISCPALRAEAYWGDFLDTQFEQQTRLFLSNQNHNRIQSDVLQLSSIFKWYRSDFEKEWMGCNSLNDFLLRYADELKLTAAHIKRLKDNKQIIEFLDYDWGLNSKAAKSSQTARK